MKRTKNALISSYLFLLLFSLCTVQSMVGQSGGDSELDSAQAAVIKPIPVEDIISRIQQADDDIKIINRKVQMKDEVKRIDSLFANYTAFLKEEHTRTKNFIKSNPNRQKINNHIKLWGGYKDQLASWEVSIDQYEERNVGLLDGILIDERIWDLTYDNALQEKIPRELITNVRKTRDEYKNLKRRIRIENNKLLITESRINKQIRLIDEEVDQLIALKNSEVYDLLHLRHEPLWLSDFTAKDDKSRSSTTSDSLFSNLKSFWKYLGEKSKSFFWYFVLVALMTMAIRWMRSSFDKYEYTGKDSKLQRGKQFLQEHPRNITVFSALVLAWYFFENQPMIFTDLLLLAILVSSIPLIKPFMKEGFGSLLYLVVIIYILDTAKTYIWFTSPQYRLYMMVEAILVISILFKYTYKHIRTLKFGDYRFRNILIKLAPVFMLIAVVSIISNILGYTNLADLTVKICTKTGVFTVIYYAMMLVFSSFGISILHRHYNSRDSFSQERKEAIETRFLNIVTWVVLIMWTIVLLRIVDLLEPLQQYFTDMLTDPYKFGNITITLGDVLEFVTILAVSFLATSVISFFLDSGKVTTRLIKLPKGVPAAISLVIRYFIIATGIVLALSTLGVDLSKFNLMAGALGLGIGFGLQNVISNFVSGLILVFERPILVGDTIEVNSLMGTVNRIGVRSSNIRTFDGAEVVVPNSNLISNDLINWTLSDSMKRVEILVGAAYGTDPNKVLDVFKEVLDDHDEILKDPEPLMLFSEFGDSSLNFSLRFWVPFSIALSMKSKVSIALYNKFAENDIEIPFPQQDVHIKELPSGKGPV